LLSTGVLAVIAGVAAMVLANATAAGTTPPTGTTYSYDRDAPFAQRTSTSVSPLAVRSSVATEAGLPRQREHDGSPGFLAAEEETPILGEGGTQTTSTTLLRDTGQGYRIDVENPAPGVRPGQLHLQTDDGKYLYDFETNEFEGLPRSLQKEIADNPAVARAIAKARVYLNVPAP
jgi:hypothetical protein